MNKILLNSDDIVNNLVIEEDTDLIIKNINNFKNINIIIKENICLSIIELGEKVSDKIIITLEENSRLILKRYINSDNSDIEINLNGIFSNCDIYNSVVSDIDSYTNFDIRHNNSNTISNLYNHGINKSKKSFSFKVNAYISSNGIESITKQENKIINMKCGKSNIYPNLIVDTDNVFASHSANISDFDKEVLFYMKSRGINEIDSRKLLINSFILNNVDLDYIDDVKTILNIN